MSWDYQKFPRHPFTAEKFEIIGINTIILYYSYRVDPKLGNGDVSILRIPCACPDCVAQLDKYLLPNFTP